MLFRKRQGKGGVVGKNHVTHVGYHVRDIVMNSSEGTFFTMLVKDLPENYYVFPKMRIADIIETELDGKSHNKHDRVIRDEFVDKLFEDCKIKLLRVNVGGDFKFVIDAILQKYLS